MSFERQGTPRSFWRVGKRDSRKTRQEGGGQTGQTSYGDRRESSRGRVGGEAGAKRRGIENGQDSGSAPCDLVMVGACHSAPVQACGTHNTEGEA